jgi:hypothetical protein
LIPHWLGGRRRWVDRLLRRRPGAAELSVWIARFGYGARGFVYVSVGLIMLLSALDLAERPIATTGVMPFLLQQPLGRLWVAALGVGLWGFVLWRALQALFDADRVGRSASAMRLRMGQAFSGVAYAIIASGAFELLDEVGGRLPLDDVAENQEKAAWLLSLPLGGVVLMAIGCGVLAAGGLNVVKAMTEDFADMLECSPTLCRRVTPLARVGHVARGLSYAPLGLLLILAGWSHRASQTPSFGSALTALERLPAGGVLLGLTALGLMAFGAFAVVEARFRRIRPPKHLSL